MPRLVWFSRTERVISWLARRMAPRTRRAGAGRSSSRLRVVAWEGTVSSPGSSDDMWREIESTARRDATSPAACPPMPSATTYRPSPSARTKESSFILRLRPTSVIPVARICSGMSSSDTGVTGGGAHPFAARRRQFLQEGECRLVVGLVRQHGAQLVRRLGVLALLGQREAQVEPGDEVVGVHLEGAAEGGDRLLPLLVLPEGDTEVVVDIGEIGAEPDREPQRLGRGLQLALAQAPKTSAEVEIEALGPAQEGGAHVRRGLVQLVALEAGAPRGMRLVDGAHRQVAHRLELARGADGVARFEEQERQLDAGLHVVGVQLDGPAQRLDGVGVEAEPGAQRSQPE